VVVDQGLFSTANFVSMLLLARWMSPTEFGVLSTIQLLTQLAAAPYFSLLTEPMSVLGASLFRASPRAYERVLRIAHVSLCLAIGIVVSPVLWLTLGPAIAHLRAIAVLFVIFLSLYFAAPFARRHCYNKRRIDSAAGISVTYSSILLLSLFVLDRAGQLSSMTAWGVVATCSAAASARTLIAMGRRPARDEPALPIGQVIREHWAFGRWDVIGFATFLIAQQLPVMAMTRWSGPGSAGALRALLLVAVPMTLLSTSTASAVLPVVAAVESRGDRSRATFIAFATAAGVSAVAAVYLIMTYFFAAPLVHLLYGGKYGEYAWLVPLLALQVLVGVMTLGCNVHMRAARWPKFSAISAPVVLLASAINTLVFVRDMGIVGTVYAILIMNSAGAVTNLSIYVWWRRAQKNWASAGRG
jgi:O-antigen/teichoic acid export membrane protein